MYQGVWLAKTDPFYSRQAFAAACAKDAAAAPSVNSLAAWEVDYLLWLFRDTQWRWVHEARTVAPLKPDVVVFMSNDFHIDGVLDAWTPKVFVHLSDEWGRTPLLHQRTEQVPLVLRQYRFNHYYRPKNVRHMPLGFMACMFDDPDAIAAPDPVTERHYKWSFVGSIKGERMNALSAFDSWTPHWKTSCSPRELAHAYRQSVFVLCPRGNVRMDCFRNYEATVCGAIPIVAGCSTEEYVETFCGIGNPPWVFCPTWEEALLRCRRLYDSGAVSEMQTKNLQWWASEIHSIRVAIAAALQR